MVEADRSIVLDKSELLERLGGDTDLLQEVAALFLEDCPKLMSNIQGAIRARDAFGLERAAHALKGSVSNFGPTSAYDAAYSLEKLGRAGELDGALTACLTLEEEIDRFQQALTRLAAEVRN